MVGEKRAKIRSGAPIERVFAEFRVRERFATLVEPGQLHVLAIRQLREELRGLEKRVAYRLADSPLH